MDDKDLTSQTIEDDLSTTAPNPAQDAWSMPEPVFRKTSGKLPQGFQRGTTSPASESPVPSAEPSPASSPISSSPTPAARPKGSALKLILVLLGIGAMTAFLIVFLTVVYFFLLRSE